MCFFGFASRVRVVFFVVRIQYKLRRCQKNKMKKIKLKGNMSITVLFITSMLKVIISRMIFWKPYNFHSQSNIKNDFLKALSGLSCKRKKQIENWLTLMLNNSCTKIANAICFSMKGIKLNGNMFSTVLLVTSILKVTMIKCAFLDFFQE